MGIESEFEHVGSWIKEKLEGTDLRSADSARILTHELIFDGSTDG